MAISQITRKALYKRAGGRCECRMNICKHHSAGQRCPRSLVSGEWIAHHRVADAGDNLNNLVAMCATCFNNIETHGRQ